MRIKRLLLVSLVSALLALSTIYARDEYGALRKLQTPLTIQIQALIEDETFSPFPRSIRYQTTLLNNCVKGQKSPSAVFAPEADRLSLARSCAKISSIILAQSPTHSLAYIMDANTAVLKNDPNMVNEALTLAYKTGLNEGWLAEQRVSIALGLDKTLSTENEMRLNHDIALLLQGHRTRPFIAHLYLHEIDTKSRIVSLVEQQPVAIQRAFLASVQLAAK